MVMLNMVFMLMVAGGAECSTTPTAIGGFIAGGSAGGTLARTRQGGSHDIAPLHREGLSTLKPSLVAPTAERSGIGDLLPIAWANTAGATPAWDSEPTTF